MATFRHIASLSLIGVLAVPLAACGGGEGLRDILGYGKNAPDEFAIVTKAPLVIPPDFSLRPPRPGAPRPQDAAPSAMARAALVGEEVQVAGVTGSQGEQVLLKQAGASEADANIRTVIKSESQSLTDRDPGFVDNMLNRGTQAPPTHVVDAQAEARRLQGNEAQGLGVSEGVTPMYEEQEKKKGWFSRMWDGVF